VNIRKSLIKLANRIESAWQFVDFSSPPIKLDAGWYVTEFLVKGAVAHIPRIIVEDVNQKPQERKLVGFHTGRNRMLIYLPEGRMQAHSESIEFIKLAKVPWWEGRARILLICFRYLLDFFSPWVVLKMIAMQFKNPFELSSDLLHFYAPPAETVGYLYDITWWQRFEKYGPQLAWFYRHTKIAVLIEDESQREALEELMVSPDAVILAEQGMKLASDIDYLIPLAKTEVLRSPAILMLKRALKKAKSAGKSPKLVYTDHDYDFDEEQGDRIMEPVFKPMPSAPYMHCFNYIGFSVMFATSELANTDLSDLHKEQFLYRLGLAMFSNIEDVLHVPDVLFLSSRQETLKTPEAISENSFWPDINCQRRNEHNALVACDQWRASPSVDLIIPTRDGLQVLKPCINSILKLTDYPNFKVIIVDNGSEESETHEFFAEVSSDPRVSVVEYPGEFNYSAINNFAIAQGDSDYVAMVNNDIEVIHADWLQQMMVWAKQSNVGIVGAKLLFGNGLVQHAGVTIGMGNAAGHIHRLEAGDAPGYQNRCIATQNMMAVTAACLITPRSLFEQLGGLDAQDLKVAYNDIDYCLRVEQLGMDVIWTPEARLYHHESVSRGDDMSDKHIELAKALENQRLCR